MPQGLSAIRAKVIPQAIHRIDSLDDALKKDPLVRVKIKRDPIYSRARMLREHMVCGTETYFQADRENKALVPYFERLWAETPGELQGRMNLARGITEGDSWLQMRGTEKQMRISPDRDLRKWWTIGALTHIPAEQIKMAWKDEQKVTPSGDSYSHRTYYYAILDMEQAMPLWYEVENLEHYMRLSYGANGYSAGYGEGIIQNVFQYWRIKTHLLKKLTQYLDRYGTPWLVGLLKDGFGASGGGDSENPSVEDRAVAFRNEVERMNSSGGNVLTMDAEDKLQVVDASGPAMEAAVRLLEYCDRGIVEAVMGAMESEGSGFGEGAKAEVQQGKTDIVVSFDRMVLEEAMHTGTLALWNYNYHNFLDLVDAETGQPLAMLTPPRRKIGKEAEDDLSENLAILEGAQRLGLTLDEEQARAKLQLEKPGPNSTVLAPPGAAGGLGSPAINPLTGQPPMPAPEYAGGGLSMSEGQHRRPRVTVRAPKGGGVTFADHWRNGGVDAAAKYIRDHAQAIRGN